MARTKLNTIPKGNTNGNTSKPQLGLELPVVAEEAPQPAAERKPHAEYDLDSNTVSFFLSGHRLVLREPNAMDFQTLQDWAVMVYGQTGEVPGNNRMTLKMAQLCAVEFDEKFSDDPSIPAVSFKEMYKLFASKQDVEVLGAALDLFRDRIAHIVEGFQEEASESEPDSDMPKQSV